MYKEYKILIDNVDYTKYLQLPFSIQEKITEAYDTAEVLLDFTNRKTPFKKNSLVEIHILDGTFPFDGKPYYFLVSNDQVDQSVKNSKKTLYSHKLSLIECTKKADNIFLSPWTITNRTDASYVEQDLAGWIKDGNTWAAIFSESGYAGIYYNKSGWFAHFEEWEMYAWFKQHFSLKGSMAREYEPTDRISFPSITNWQEGGWKYKNWKTTIGFIQTGVNEKSASPNLPLFLRYYIQIGSTWYTLGETRVESGRQYLVNSYRNGFNVSSNSQAYFSGLGVGTYNLRIRSVQYNETYDKNRVMYNSMAGANWDYAGRVASKIAENSSPNNTSHGYYQTTITVVEQMKKPTTTTFKTLKEVLDKIIAMINPDHGTFSYDVPDYKLNVPVPDLIFDGIKSLSEILFQIGRILKSVPYIDKNNVITFETYSPDDNAKFDLLTEKLGLNLGSNYYASGFITDLSNIVNVSNTGNTIYTYYPAKNGWTTARAKDSSSTIMTPDNSAINIENSRGGIYAIKEIRVKNFWKGGDGYEAYTEPAEGLDIADFCYEKTAYDALYKGCRYNADVILSNTCQANCFYYIKGDNKIIISGMSENEALAIFGNADSCTYQVQNAIGCAILRDTRFDIAKVSSTSGNIRKYGCFKDPNEYQYQVVFVDQFNSVVKTQQFDMSAFTEPFDTNYNQESQTISAYNYGITSQEEISRRGNEVLASAKSVYNLTDLPQLGEIHEFNDQLFLADEIEYTFYNNFAESNLSFTKDYNKINDLVQLSREYRQYRINPEEKVERNIPIYDYCYLDKDSFSVSSSDKALEIVDYSTLIPTNNTNQRKQFPTFAVLFFKNRYDANGNIVYTNNYHHLGMVKYSSMFKGEEVTLKEISPIIVPITPSIIGNSLLLNFALMDNFAAGSYLTGTQQKYKDLFGVEKDGGFTQEWCRYVDDYGEAYSVSIYIIDASKNNSLKDYFKRFPYAINSSGTAITESTAKANSVWYMENYPIYKDMNERISFTYQLHFCTESNKIKWNQYFAKYLMYDKDDPMAIFKDSSGEFVSSYKPAYYGIYNSELNNGTLLKENYRFLGYPTSSKNSINAITVTPQDNFDAYAFVIPKTMEVLFHVNQKLEKGVSTTLDPVKFTFINKIIKS